MPVEPRSPGTPAEDARIYQRGLAAFEAGQYRDAVELLEQVAASANLSATLARFYLGQAHMHVGIEELRAGRHAQAVRHFNIARESNPESSTLSRYIAAAYASQRRFDLAAAEIERDSIAGKHDPARPIRLAHAFARDGQFERAVETLVRVIDEEPYRVDVRMNLGLLYGAAERFEDAVCVFTEVIEIAPFDPEARVRLGLALAAAGDHSEAVEHIAIAQKLRPTDAYIGMLLAMAGDAARSSCIKVAIDPVHGRLGVVDDRSLEMLGELIVSDPEFVEGFLNLPESEIDHEVFAMLAAVLERALEKQPDYADLYFHCSRVYARLGRTHEAVTRADQAVEINPRYVQALIHLARLHARTDKTDEAIDRLKCAVASGGDYPDVHYLLGELLRKEGNIGGARREYHRALELNDNYQAARRALATVGVD